LKKAVYQYGPIAIAVDATPRTFEFYSGGIYNDKKCDPNDLTHAMLLVGYGTENGQDYWLLKNSWGTSWGLVS
jgi:cathepsin L